MIQSQLLNNIATALANDKKAFAFEVLTATTSVQKLNVPNGATYAIIQTENGSGATSTSKLIRFKYAGTPTASEGFIQGDMDVVDLNDYETINNFRFIIIDGTAHKLNVQYFK